MRIKIFEAIEPSWLEQQVNEWIEKNEDIIVIISTELIGSGRLYCKIEYSDVKAIFKEIKKPDDGSS